MCENIDHTNSIQLVEPLEGGPIRFVFQSTKKRKENTKNFSYSILFTFFSIISVVPFFFSVHSKPIVVDINLYVSTQRTPSTIPKTKRNYSSSEHI